MGGCALAARTVVSRCHRAEVNQVRDPAIFEEDGRVYLLYAVKGEAGIAIVELIEQT